MIEPVKVELVDIIFLFRFMDQYIRLITRPSLPEWQDNFCPNRLILKKLGGCSPPSPPSPTPPYAYDLPHLVCAPCVRRLNNFIQFKSTVTETQRLLLEDTRAKRCVEISPSVAKPSAKVRATGTSRRRSINFDISSGDQLLTENATSSTTSLALHVSYSIFYLCFVCGRIYFIFPYRIFSAIIMNMHSSDSCIYKL